jgi:REP element-mobilizing transposase RayT
MPNYRRAFLLGGCWFFTVNLLDRRQSLLVDHIDALRSAFAATRKNHPFDIAAIVVLPDHLHAVWTLCHRTMRIFRRAASVERSRWRDQTALERSTQ